MEENFDNFIEGFNEILTDQPPILDPHKGWLGDVATIGREPTGISGDDNGRSIPKLCANLRLNFVVGWRTRDLRGGAG